MTMAAIGSQQLLLLKWKNVDNFISMFTEKEIVIGVRRRKRTYKDCV